MRKHLRWVLVTMLAFGLGALFIAFGPYIPTRQKLDIANADLEHRHAEKDISTASGSRGC